MLLEPQSYVTIVDWRYKYTTITFGMCHCGLLTPYKDIPSSISISISSSNTLLPLIQDKAYTEDVSIKSLSHTHKHTQRNLTKHTHTITQNKYTSLSLKQGWWPNTEWILNDCKYNDNLFMWFCCLNGKLWHLQHNCVWDTTANH